MPDTLTIIAMISQIIAFGFVIYVWNMNGTPKHSSRKASKK
jgi:hypothetical protein